MLHIYILVFILSPSFFPAGFSDLTTDRAALLRLREAVKGRTLLWNSSESDPCSWQGIACDFNRVSRIRLPAAGLSGEIPVNTIGNLSNLRILSLRKNSLSGKLPEDLGSCTELQHLNLQENNFSSEIPVSLFGLNKLTRLSLSNNSLSGDISPEFNKLTQLKTLLLKNNHLTGSLPDLNNLDRLSDFDVSFNKLTGSIPSYFRRFSSDNFTGNSLCGSPLGSCEESEGSKLSDGAIVGIVVGSVTALLVVILLSFLLFRKYRIMPQSATPSPQILPEIRSRNLRQGTEDRGVDYGVSRSVNSEDGTRNNGLVFFKEKTNVFGFEDLLRASAEVMGKDSKLGSTYKAYLDGGNVVVVKRLKNVGVSADEFTEKVQKLGNLVHENLISPKGYFCGMEEKLLVYEYMPMGSLSDALHGEFLFLHHFAS